MKVRYKKYPDITRDTNQFNPCGLSEIVMHDDSAFIRDLDVMIKGEWVDMGQAFKNKDIIPSNDNLWFAEPKTPEDRERGYFL